MKPNEQGKKTVIEKRIQVARQIQEFPDYIRGLSDANKLTKKPPIKIEIDWNDPLSMLIR
jgi:hypothetical protein